VKLIVAVVRDEFAPALTEQLTKKGFGATKLASTGGFLKAGNSTFLIGVPAGQMDEAVSIIRSACPSRKGADGPEAGGLPAGVPAGTVPIQAGGATVFVLPVERMIKV